MEKWELSLSSAFPTPMPDPDFQCYARDRDPEGFRRLVERHLPAVRATAVRVLDQRSALAEDVVQTVFTLLARKAASLPEELVPGAWLHRQTVRRALNVLRTETRRERRERQFMQTATTDGNTGDTAALWQELRLQLDRALLALPEKDRQALVLRYLEERPLTEVAGRLGLTPNAAQKRVSKAVEGLRRRLLRHRVVLPSASLLSTLLTDHAAQAASSAAAHPAAATAAATSVTAASVAAKALAAAALPAASGPLAFLTVMNFAKSLGTAALLLLLAGAGWQSAAHLPAPAPALGPVTALPSLTVRKAGGTLLPDSPWLKTIGRASAEDFPALAAEALKEKDLLRRHDRLEAVFARWVEVAPKEGWDWVQKNCSEDLGADRLPRDPRLAFLLSWITLDGPTAYAARWGQPSRKYFTSWDTQLAVQWARKNPRSLLDFVRSGKWEKSPIEAQACALRSLAATDPEEVYREALQLPDNQRRASVIAAVAASLAARDADQALAWAREVPPGFKAREEAYCRSFEVMAGQDPARTARLMDGILVGPLAQVRAQAARPLLESWMRTDAAAALKWASTLNARAAAALEGLVDPGSEEARTLLKNLESDDARGQWERWMSGSWDPSAAAGWLKSQPLPDDESAFFSTRAALASWAREDVGAAAAWLDQLPDGKARENLRQLLLARIADGGASPELLMAQLKELHGIPGDDEVRGAAAALAGERPDEVLALIGKFPAGEGRDGWLAQAARAWADHDPQAAAAWADGLPSPETRTKVTEEILARWWPDDPPAAEAWIAAQPEGPLRDSGLAQVSQAMAPEAPARALEWAVSIGEAGARTASLASVLKEWSRTSPASALAALEALPVDPAEKAGLASPLTAVQPDSAPGPGAATPPNSTQP